MIKLTKNGITTLKKQYRSVLLKCLAINAGVFMLAAPALADVTTEMVDTYSITANETKEIKDKIVIVGTEESSGDIANIKGNLTITDGGLQVGGNVDEWSKKTSANLVADGANITLAQYGDGFGASGNVTIKNSEVKMLGKDYLVEEEGIAVGSMGNLTIDNSKFTAEAPYLFIFGQGKLAINESAISMLGEESSINAEGEKDQYNSAGENLEIKNSKITLGAGSEITLTRNADYAISGDKTVIDMNYTDFEGDNEHDGGILHEGQKGNLNISGGTINLTGKVAKIERGGYDGDWIYNSAGETLVHEDDFYEVWKDHQDWTMEQVVSQILGREVTDVDHTQYHVSEGDINISGGTLNLKDGARISTTAKNTGDINISGSAKIDLSESEIRGIGGNINVKGGTIKLSSKNDEAGHQNMSGLNPHGYVQTGNNLGLVSAKNINISGGEIILNGESIDAMGNINFTGGTINETGSEIDATLWAGGNINLNGGTINVQDDLDVNTFYHKLQDEKFVPVDATKGLITIDGSTINLAKDAWMDLESTNKVSFNSGTINVAEDAGFSVYNTLKENQEPDEHGIYHEGFFDEDILGTLYAGKASVINLANGELDANYVGNGQINITGPKAYLNGNVNMTDGGVMNVDANQALADGDVTFAKGSTLKMAITDAANGQLKANKIVAEKDSTLSLNITKTMQKDETASFKLFDAETIDNNFSNVAQNARYEISTEDGANYNVKYTASASDVVEEAGGSANNAATAEAWDNLMNATGVSEITKAIVNLLNELSQQYPQEYTAALTALAPETAPAATQTATETAGAVFNAVGSRLSGGSVTGNQGMSSGDALDGVAVWVQGMINHAKFDGNKHSKGFDSDTWGTALGVEKQLNRSVKAGVGYAYSKTDIGGFMRDTDVKTHTAILYGEYKPSNWYANAVVSYGWSDYDEKKNVARVMVKSKYDLDALALQAMTGYDIYSSFAKITPEVGLRYIHVEQDDYTDTSGQHVKSKDSDILTGVMGAKIAKSYSLLNGMLLTPEFKAAMTYDISHDNSESTITLVNGSSYSVSGKPLNRFGVEVGGGMSTELNDNVEVFLGYEGKFRKDYQDHSGLVNAKYKF